MSRTDKPFTVLYRWKLRPGSEDVCVEAWTAATRRLLSAGSLGSRLHRGNDGIWYSYAILQEYPEVILESISDHLQPIDGAIR